jgi:dCMP deaminase
MVTSRVSKSEYFLALAVLASLRSTCVRRKVGCILVDKKGRVLATGYNGVASGETHCNDKPCEGAVHKSGEGLDDCKAIHAEQNAILQCKDTQEIRTAYVTTAPCVSCTKLLLNTSCKTIVFLESYPNSGRKIWNRSWIKHGSIRHVFTKIELETTD